MQSVSRHQSYCFLRACRNAIAARVTSVQARSAGNPVSVSPCFYAPEKIQTWNFTGCSGSYFKNLIWANFYTFTLRFTFCRVHPGNNAWSIGFTMGTFLLNSVTTRLLYPSSVTKEYINSGFILLPASNAECLEKMTSFTTIQCVSAS